MLVVHDPRCAEYGSGLHPEKPERVTRTAEFLHSAFPKWDWKVPEPIVADRTLRLAHSPQHLARLEEPVDFDADTAAFPDIAVHARRAASAALLAGGHAYAHTTPAFSLMRPPGHHATSGQAMGFCYLNQVAVTALSARQDLGARRVAIWDFDAHHGNGTEAILHGRDGFLVCSVHQSPGYPGTGLRDKGNSRNWPLPPGTPRDIHMEALRASLEVVCDFDPDLLLVSAGFDAYARDPITEMSLEAEDFATLGRWLREADRPAAAILEGGYSPDLPVLVAAFLSSWEA